MVAAASMCQSVQAFHTHCVAVSKHPAVTIPADWHLCCRSRLQLAQAEAARLSREIGTMQAAMRAGDVDPAQLARRVASQHEARDRALLLMERLQLVEPLVNRQPGANLRNVRGFSGSECRWAVFDIISGHTLQIIACLCLQSMARAASRLGPRRTSSESTAAATGQMLMHSERGRSKACETDGVFLAVQIQDNLEASFVSEAEMVFTTLSSTGRKVCPPAEPATTHPSAQSTCWHQLDSGERDASEIRRANDQALVPPWGAGVRAAGGRALRDGAHRRGGAGHGAGQPAGLRLRLQAVSACCLKLTRTSVHCLQSAT